MTERERQGPVEIALVGDLSNEQKGLCDSLLDVEPGAECILYFDSPGGSPYTALALTSLMLMRELATTGIVAGECSSAAVLPFAACRKRVVTQYSVLLFHPMKWQSEENVSIVEASEWARHFGHLEAEMDRLLAELLGLPLERIHQWVRPGRYVSGPELAETGAAELVDLKSYKVCRGHGK